MANRNTKETGQQSVFLPDGPILDAANAEAILVCELQIFYKHPWAEAGSDCGLGMERQRVRSYDHFQACTCVLVTIRWGGN